MNYLSHFIFILAKMGTCIRSFSSAVVVIVVAVVVVAVVVVAVAVVAVVVVAVVVSLLFAFSCFFWDPFKI